MNMHPSLRNPQHKINGNFKAEFGELYTLLWDKMLNTVCRKYTKDIDKAKDYCQNGFIKV